MAVPWADQPYPLIPTPKSDDTKVRRMNYIDVHNAVGLTGLLGIRRLTACFYHYGTRS